MSPLLLDQAGTVLPEALGFFKPGWWVVHLLAIVLVFAYGYRKGRRDERREQRVSGREGQKASGRETRKASGPGATM